MANPIKGEVSRELAGKKYTFVLGTYGLAALERRMKMPWHKVFKKAGDGEWGISDVVSIIYCGLLRHHRDITEEQVCDLIDEAGMAAIVELIGEAALLMQPEGSRGSEIPENPTKPGNGQLLSGTTSYQTG